MKKTKKIIALIMALTLILCMGAPAFASAPETASLTIYKYDIKKALDAGVYGEESYVADGTFSQETVDALNGCAIEGVEFTYLKIADCSIHTEAISGEMSTITLYSFEKSECTTEVLAALGLTEADAYYSTASELCFTSEQLNTALATAIAENAVEAKNAMEALAKKYGTAMTQTDYTGRTTAADIPVGLYLIVETKVPGNVTNTTDPFLVSLPMMTVDGSAWNYDVTIYPKSSTGMPTLEKLVREAKKDTGKNNGTNSISDGFAHVATASTGDELNYEILSTLPTISSDATALTTYLFEDSVDSSIIYKKGDVLIEFYKDAACTEHITTWDQVSGKFTVDYTEYGMNVTITDTGLDEINNSTAVYNSDAPVRGYSDCTLRLSYSSVLRADSTTKYGDSSNNNYVKMRWARTGGAPESIMSDAHVHTFGLELTKKFSDDLGNFANVKFNVKNSTDNYYVIAELREGVYYVTGHTDNNTEATQFIPDSSGMIIVKGLEDDKYLISELTTDIGYTALKDGVELALLFFNGLYKE